MDHFAEILAEAIALFPGGAPPRERQARQAALEKVDQPRLQALDSRFFDAYRKDEEIALALEQYINTRQGEFLRD